MDKFEYKLESVLSSVTQSEKSLLNQIFDTEISQVCLLLYFFFILCRSTH